MDIVGLIHRENTIYGVSFPDLLGCVSAGDSFQEMMDMGAEALSLHLEEMLNDGDVIPDFRSMAELEADAALAEEFAEAEFAIHYGVVFSGKSVTVTYDLLANPLKHLRAAAE